MSEGRGIWSLLGIEPTDDLDKIRRAYARQLKSTNPEDDSEAFLGLRAAYEAALGHARFAAVKVNGTAADHDVGVGPAQSAVIPEIPPRPPAPEIDALTSDGRQLHELLNAPGTFDRDLAEQVLFRILQSPALDTLNVQINAERGLADMMLRAGRNGDVLLPILADWFGWSVRMKGFRVDPLIAAAFERLNNAQLAREFHSRDGRAGIAFRSILSAPNRPYWIGLIALLGIDFKVRRLLQEIGPRPGLRRFFNTESLTWWSRYIERWMTAVTLIRVLLLVDLVCFVVPDQRLRRVIFPMNVGLVFAFCIWKAYRRWMFGLLRAWLFAPQRRRYSTVALYGWYPTAIAVWIGSTYLPNSRWAVGLALVLSAASLGWAVAASGAQQLVPGAAGAKALYWKLVLNLPIPVAWFLMAHSGDVFISNASWLPLLLLLVSYERGRTLLLGSYEARLSLVSRVLISVAILLMGAAAALYIYWFHDHPITPWMCALPIVLVLIQRTGALTLDKDLQTLRFRGGWASIWFSQLIENLDPEAFGSRLNLLQNTAAWLILLVIGTQVLMIIRFWTQYRERSLA